MPSNNGAEDKGITLTWVGNNTDEFFDFGKYLELWCSIWYRANIGPYSSFHGGLRSMGVQMNPDIQVWVCIWEGEFVP